MCFFVFACKTSAQTTSLSVNGVKFRFKSVSRNWLYVCIKITAKEKKKKGKNENPLAIKYHQSILTAHQTQSSGNWHIFFTLLRMFHGSHGNVFLSAYRSVWKKNPIVEMCGTHARISPANDMQEFISWCDSNLDLNNPSIYWLLNAHPMIKWYNILCMHKFVIGSVEMSALLMTNFTIFKHKPHWQAHIGQMEKTNDAMVSSQCRISTM